MRRSVRALAVLAAAAGFLAVPRAATAAPDYSIPIPCALPADAVTQVPAPFDKYMVLICTAAGQTLKPVDGYQWVFHYLNNSVMWLTANNPDKPDLMPSTHFTRLSAVTLSPDQVKAFQDEIFKLVSSPIIYQTAIFKMDEETSGGARKQVYLIVPPDGANLPALGIECVQDCQPMEESPWLFAVVPVAPR